VEVGDLRSAELRSKDSVDGAERTGSGRAFQSVTVLKEGVFVGISAGRKWDECISFHIVGCVSRAALPEMISRD